MENDKEVVVSKEERAIRQIKPVDRQAVQDVLSGKLSFSDIPLSHPYWQYRDLLTLMS